MNTDNKIETGLRHIRILKTIFWAMFFGILSLPILEVFTESRFTQIIPFIYLPLWVIIGIIKNNSNCPLCEKKFYIEESNGWNSWKTLTNSCLNCKLKLDGSNLNEVNEEIKET